MKMQLIIPKAPDFIYDKPRQRNLLGEESVSFLLDTYIGEDKKIHPNIVYMKDVGILNFFKGVSLPSKGFQTVEAMVALNQIKKLLVETTKLARNPLFFLWLATSEQSAMSAFNIIFDKMYGAHSIKSEYLCACAYAVEAFLTKVLGNQQFAHNIAQILEQDDAYRYRLQDLLTELNTEWFKKNPRKELQRLAGIWEERESEEKLKGTYKKLQHLITLAGIVLLIPSLKRKVCDNIYQLKAGEFDSADRFWVSMTNNFYNYFGMTPEERLAQYPENERPYYQRITI